MLLLLLLGGEEEIPLVFGERRFLGRRNTADEDNDDEDNETIPFFTTYGIVAETPEEALSFIKKYEIEQIDKDSLSIIEIEETANDEEEPKGIHHVGGMAISNF